MSNLIAIHTNDKMEQTVSTRELHNKLGIKDSFTNWFKYQTNRLGLIDGKDFIGIFQESTGGRPSADYMVTINIAKHLCMVSGGVSAHQIREYFIDAENAWNSPDMVMARAVRLAEKKIASLEEERKVLLPKAHSHDVLMSASGCLTINEVAKTLDIKGIGQNNLFKMLTLEKIIYKKGNAYLPYQQYRSYFVVKQNPIKKGDAIIQRSQLYMSTRGLNWLANKLIRMGYQTNYCMSRAVV